MSAATHPFASPREFVRAVRLYPRRVLVPAVIVATLVGFYAAVRPDTWEATQPLAFRNDAAGNNESLGKFRYPEELKTKQETILEIGKSNGVLVGALKKVGPPSTYKNPEAWPSAQDVADFRREVKLAPPKGVEVGTTELFYVKVKANSRERAEALAGAVASELRLALQRLREDRAQSMVDELTKAVALNEADLEASTERLTAMEKQVGEDLSELRNLQEFPSGDSDIRRRTVEIENELRHAQIEERNDQELLKLLAAAQEDPRKLVATPNRLLESQPSLRKLKEGLIDAQLKSADIVGRLSDEHPLTKAARNSEAEIRHNLFDEISSAKTGVEVNLRLTTANVEALKGKLKAEQDRLERLASLRAKYANLSGAVKQRTLLVEVAQRDLTAARGAKAAAQIASIITLIDTPDAGVKPVGPSRAVTGIAGVFGGLIFGLGVLFLSLPAGPLPAEEMTADLWRREQARRESHRDLSFNDDVEDPSREPVGSVHD